VAPGRFSPSTSVSPAIHSTKFSIFTITRGRYNRPINGRRAEWTQFGLHPPLCKKCIYLSIYLSFLSFLIYTQSVGRFRQGISPSQGRYVHTEQHKHRINANRVGFEPTIPVFERAKTVHALDRAPNDRHSSTVPI
jgi:hypothetical protein